MTETMLPAGYYRVPVVSWVVIVRSTIKEFGNSDYKNIKTVESIGVEAGSFNDWNCTELMMEDGETEKPTLSIIPAAPRTYKIYQETEKGDKAVSYEVDGVFSDLTFNLTFGGVGC